MAQQGWSPSASVVAQPSAQSPFDFDPAQPFILDRRTKRVPLLTPGDFPRTQVEPVMTTLDVLVKLLHQDTQLTKDRQAQLVAAGLLAPGSYEIGYVDNNTLNALKTAASEASYYGQSLTEILSSRTDAHLATLNQAGVLAGKDVFQPMADVSLHDAIRTAYQSEYGRKPTRSEIASHAKVYRALERQHFEAGQRLTTERALAQTRGEQVPSATIEQLAPPAELTQEQLGSTAEAGAYDIAGAMEHLRSLVGGS